MSGTPVEGRSALRCWSVRRTENATVADVWSDRTQKLSVFATWVVALIPAILLWTLVGTHSTSRVHWLAAVGYTLVVFVTTVVLVEFMGREVVRLDAHGLTVRRFGIFAWVSEYLETRIGADVVAGDGAGFLCGLAAHTGARRVDFGRMLPNEPAEAIAAALRAGLAEPQSPGGGIDGVVRRVPRHQSQHTPPGALDLMPAEGLPPMVFGGVLRWGPRPPPWTMMLIPLWIAFLVSEPFGDPEARLVPVLAATLAAGVLACRGGVVDRVLLRRRRALAERHTDEPWKVVPYWRDGVVVMPVWRRCGLSSGALALGAAAVAAVVFEMDGVGRGVLLAISGAWCVVWAYRLQNVVFQGVTEVRVRSVPVPARGDVVLDFAVGRRGANFESIRCTLVRMVEVPRLGEGAFVGYSHRAEYELPDDQPPPAPGEQVELRFSLPEDASGTDLARGRPVYWLLEVEGETSSGFYSETFPVPIYDVP